VKSFLNFITENTAKVYHGGDLSSGRKPVVTYWTPDLEMAKSYVDMTHDRFGGDPKIHEKTLTIHSAPWELIKQEAIKAGMDQDDLESYTPASVFDSELHEPGMVKRTVDALKRHGYSGAILTDIAYGKQIEADAWIEFN